jgi:hypothetical protein
MTSGRAMARLKACTKQFVMALQHVHQSWFLHRGHVTQQINTRVKTLAFISHSMPSTRCTGGAPLLMHHRYCQAKVAFLAQLMTCGNTLIQPKCCENAEHKLNEHWRGELMSLTLRHT